MSYNSYKQSSRGSRGYGGGRGYVGGGGYRGSNRGGGDSGGWRGGGRGSYSNSSSRGRFSSRFDKDNSGSYESRARYSGGISDGYATREDNSHRRYRDDAVYSGRDRSHRASSPDRKRMRTEFTPASSIHHRSHDYGDGIDYSNRSYSGYGDSEMKRVSRGYAGGDDRRGSFREERERMRSDDYQYRKSMSSLASPRHSTPRGLYRGRTFSRGRGVGRSSFKRNENYRGYLTKKRALMDSFGFRKRGIGSKTQEYLQRLKLYRLKSKLGKEKASATGEDDEDDEKEIDEDEDEEEEEEVEEEVEEEIEEEVTDEGDEEMEEGEQKEEEEDEKKEGEEELEEGETNDDTKKQKKVKKVKKIVKVMKKVKRKKVSSKKDGGEENSAEGVQITIKQDSESRAVNDDGAVRKNRLGKPFIKLECPHCHGVYVTFKEYTNHLFTNKHITTMTKLTLRLRQTLAKMRVDQRNDQRLLDEESKQQKANIRTLYCSICKLNYRSLKADHITSEQHTAMREFLTPYCKVCRLFFKTPMIYQHHLCQLEHIRRLAFKERRNPEKEDGKDVDIDQFMILDSVGSGEEESGEESVEEGTEVKKEAVEGAEGEVVKEEKKKRKKKKAEIKLGIEHCKKVEVLFCELCRFYLPRVGDEENILTVHCRTRNHLHRYVRFRDDQALRKRAEKLHKLREESKKKEGEAKKEEAMEVDPTEKVDDEDKSSSAINENGQKSSGKKSTAGGATEDIDMETGMDEKMWSEVDKDLGDLLREVEPGNKSSDDEDDSRAGDGRYDRFKHFEKEKHLVKEKEEDEDEDEEVVRKDEVSKKSEIEEDEEEDSKTTVAVEVNGEDKQ